MLLSDWRVLVRRWYLVVVGLLVTVGLCFGAAALVPTQYAVASTVLLLPPATEAEDGRPVNPYLSLGGLEGIADVLSAALGDVSLEREVADAGLDATYQLGRDPAAAGPVLVMEVSSPRAGDALATQELILQRLPEKLAEIQESVGVAVATRVTSTVVTRGAEPEPVYRSQLRAVLVAAVGGLAVTYLGVVLLDRLVRARRRSERERPLHEDTDLAAATSINGAQVNGAPVDGARAVVSMRRSAGAGDDEDGAAISRSLRWTEQR